MKCHNGMRQVNILNAAVMLAILFKFGTALVQSAEEGLANFYSGISHDSELTRLIS